MIFTALFLVFVIVSAL